VLSKTRFSDLLQFTRKKERAAAGCFFVDGWRWLEEALALPEAPLCVVATPDAARNPAETTLLARARACAAEYLEATPEQLARLTGSATASGVAVLVRWRPRAASDIAASLPPTGPCLVVALDGVGDPGNAGTIVRTADWFGASAVIFGEGSVEPTNPKAARATMGSLFHLPIAEIGVLDDALASLRTAGFCAVGADLEGEPLPVFSWRERVVLIVGNEANGLRPEVLRALDRRVFIPPNGRAESLNAAVAAAVLMADWRRTAGSPE
jgi:RNA methyltransferase, TrmH family